MLKEQILKRFTLKGYAHKELKLTAESTLAKQEGWDSLDVFQKELLINDLIEVLKTQIYSGKTYKEKGIFALWIFVVFGNYFISLLIILGIILKILDGIGVIKL